MGILGWSYGGYITSWMITQTDRFKAACVGAGVTNLMSFNGTSDIPTFIPDYFHGEYWDDLEPYRAHSAMFNVKDVKTPRAHTSEIKLDRLKDQRRFYSPLVSRVGRVDYTTQREGYPEGIVREIIVQHTLEKNYKIMAEPGLKDLLDNILSGKVKTWDEWHDAHIEFERVVLADFKALQEKYEALIEK